MYKSVHGVYAKSKTSVACCLKEFNSIRKHVMRSKQYQQKNKLTRSQSGHATMDKFEKRDRFRFAREETNRRRHSVNIHDEYICTWTSQYINAYVRLGE